LDVKKAVICIVIVVLIASLSVGAWMWHRHLKDQEPNAPEVQDGDFQIWHNDEIKSYARGERGEILVHLKNNTGETYSYQGSYYSFRPTARLISADGDFEISFDELPMTMEFAHYSIADGEVRDTTFTFVIPADAPSGDYDIEMSFGDCTYRQAAIQVTDEPQK
jgi:hypothetical protein